MQGFSTHLAAAKRIKGFFEALSVSIGSLMIRWVKLDASDKVLSFLVLILVVT